MRMRPGWSDRRRRTLVGLAVGVALGGSGAVVLPGEHAATAGYLAALCAFLLVAAAVVFVAVPGPGTAGTLARSAPVAASALVVAVLLLSSTTGQLRTAWALVAGAAACWTGYAVWVTRRPGG